MLMVVVTAYLTTISICDFIVKIRQTAIFSHEVMIKCYRPVNRALMRVLLWIRLAHSRGANRLRFNKKDSVFYDMLINQAELACEAANAFKQMLGDMQNSSMYQKQIVSLEHNADEVTHLLANKADATFVTPLDKEDLQKLSSQLDDVMDHIESAASRLLLYRLQEVRADLVRHVDILCRAADATKVAVENLKDASHRAAMHDMIVAVHRIENEGDLAYRKSLSDLHFEVENPDPLIVMRWKEIYDRVEVAIDACEDVANSIESVLIKYA